MSDDPSASSTTAPLPPPVAIFKRKSRPRPQARQKSTSPPADPFASSSASPVPSSSAVRLPTKKTVYNPLVQGTKRKKTRAEEDEEWARADMNDGLDDGVDVQWKGSGKAKAGGENYVTGGLDWDADEKEEEEKRKRQKLIDEALQDGIPDDGMYHGAAAYKTHIEKREDGVSAKMKSGPVKASSNIRQITVIDYQPDVCKDYKETGWCGFGDTCKFLHDRGDYLSGWQLDKQHEDSLRAKALAGEDSEEEEDIPFACLICRKEFTDPVVTKCGHFFDSACALRRFAKTPKCFACGAPTGGLFNSATAVLKKMEQKKQQRADARDELRGPAENEEGDGQLRIESGSEDES